MFLLVLLITGLHFVSLQEEYVCSKLFCDEYTTKNKCGELPVECQIQNSTHNGLMLPSLMPCNCCDYCLKTLGEGATCARGTETSGLPSNICGDMLSCSSDNKCVRIQTKCTEAQDKYEEDRKNGQLGHLQIKPNCDRNGEYVPYHCVLGEICYCVDENGQRIFGSIPYTNVAAKIMECKCSRAHNSISKLVGHSLKPNEHLRCQSDGSYDTIQCIDNKCLCVDSTDAAPSYPNRDMVNVTQINNKTLPCFDKNVHMEYDYLRECESKFVKKYEEIATIKMKGIEVFGDTYPQCGLDGYYDIVQENKTHKFCADKDGKVLENFIIKKTDLIKSSKLMNCKCALARSLILDVEKPECYNDGSYKAMQCRRGQCRCVDENGNQIEKEKDSKNAEELSCYEK